MALQLKWKKTGLDMKKQIFGEMRRAPPAPDVPYAVVRLEKGNATLEALNIARLEKRPSAPKVNAAARRPKAAVRLPKKSRK